MAGRIVGLFACVLCAFPSLVMGYFEKDSRDIPLNFWSGDESLKEKVKDVAAYNAEMARLYRRCGQVFLLTGLCWLILPQLGLGLLMLEFTLGIYVAWQYYKKILANYS